jgi:hypothetical protein
MSNPVAELAVVLFRSAFVSGMIDRQTADTFFSILDEIPQIIALIHCLVGIPAALAFTGYPVAFVKVAADKVEFAETVELAVAKVAFEPSAVGPPFFAFALGNRVVGGDVHDFAFVDDTVRICDPADFGLGRALRRAWRSYGSKGGLWIGIWRRVTGVCDALCWIWCVCRSESHLDCVFVLMRCEALMMKRSRGGGGRDYIGASGERITGAQLMHGSATSYVTRKVARI